MHHFCVPTVAMSFTTTNPAFKQVTRTLARQSKIDFLNAGQYFCTTTCVQEIDFAKPQQAICHLFECRVSNFSACSWWA